MKPIAYIDKVSKQRFLTGLKKAAAEVDDLRVPLTTIASRFIKSRRAIFNLKSPGQYADLTPTYRRRKSKDSKSLARPYPILLKTGRLRESLTKVGGENIRIVNKKSLTVGTSVPYSAYLQKGTSKMEGREFLFWGPESKAHSNSKAALKRDKDIVIPILVYVERETGRALNAKTAIKLAEARVDRLFG